MTQPHVSSLSQSTLASLSASLQALEDRGVDFEQFKRMAQDSAMADDVAALLLSKHAGAFAIEQVPTHYAYPADYAPAPLRDQIETLKSYFPSLRVESAVALATHTIPQLRLPAGAEAWFAIPRWQRIAACYADAAESLLSVLAARREFTRYPSSSPSDRGLRPETECADLWGQLCSAQPGDVIIVPAQFGLRHRGRSMRRVRELYSADEFGLGLVAVAAMLITHPTRLTGYRSLFIQCLGDEYEDADGVAQAPSFGCSYGPDARLLLYPRWTLCTHEEYGSASGFWPVGNQR